MKTIVRASLAAKIAEIPVQELRIGIQRGRFKFGIAYKDPGCKRNRYNVNLRKMSEELHIPLSEIKEKYEELVGGEQK